MRAISYDVSIRLPIKGLDNMWLGVEWLGNITWNVRELIKQSSGWDIKNGDNNGAVLPWLEMIEHGVDELTNHPEQYKQYESPNGWGTVEGTLRFYKDCREYAHEWIADNEKYLPVAIIWVN